MRGSCLRGPPMRITPITRGIIGLSNKTRGPERTSGGSTAGRSTTITGATSMTSAQRYPFPVPPTGRPPQEPASPSLGVFSSLAILVGVGVLGAYMLDLHSHTCEGCGKRWRHFGAFNFDDAQSHTCAHCGQVQWWKCGAPHVRQGSQFVMPARAPLPPASLSQLALPSPTNPLTCRPPGLESSEEGSSSRAITARAGQASAYVPRRMR